jgi:hypothetical protein
MGRNPSTDVNITTFLQYLLFFFRWRGYSTPWSERVVEQQISGERQLAARTA